MRHDGKLHHFTVQNLTLPVCCSCGEQVFTEEADEQVNVALRAHLHLLTPEQIRRAMKDLGVSQKDVALRTGIAEETISRWLNGVQIQSRSLDNLLRVYFEFSCVRVVLCGRCQDPSIGI